MPIIYKQGNFLDDADATIFCHACNCQHVWGSGVAKQLKNRFPSAFEQEGYEYKQTGLTSGTVRVFSIDAKRSLLCLYTSEGFGRTKDVEEQIILNTRKCFASLYENYNLVGEVISSPKFNTGLFGVPWQKIEPILLDYVNLQNITWHVWSFKEKTYGK